MDLGNEPSRIIQGARLNKCSSGITATSVMMASRTPDKNFVQRLDRYRQGRGKSLASLNRNGRLRNSHNGRESCSRLLLAVLTVAHRNDGRIAFAAYWI
jgi:hypothetical protein